MNFKKLCYENINDNFCMCILGKINLLLDKNTGYFNATRISQEKFNYWITNDLTLALLNNLNQIHMARYKEELVFYYEIKDDRLYSGMYLHQKLFLNFLCFVYPDFYNKCTTIVFDYFLNIFQHSITVLD